MRVKIISVAAIISAAVLVLPGVSSAQTVADLQAQIQALLAQVQQLQSQLAQQQSTTATWCHTFNTNLGIGNSGNDVTALQTALTKEGVGAEKNWTSGTFDEVTASAVTGFQEKYASDILTPNNLTNGTGYIGSATRAKLNALYGCGTTPPQVACPMYVMVCPDGSYVSPDPNNNCQVKACPITGQPSVTVLSPNGGEQWQVGQTYAVTWNASNFPAGTTINLQLSYQPTSGGTYEDVIATGLSNTGSYQWTIPSKYGVGMNSNAFKMRAILVGSNISGTNGPQDYSDAPFSIVFPTTSTQQLSITITPSVLRAGDTATIGWNTSYTGSTSFYEEGTSGQMPVLIKTMTGTAGNFSWTVPAGESGDRHIRGGNNYDGNFYSAPFNIMAGAISTNNTKLTVSAAPLGASSGRAQTATDDLATLTFSADSAGGVALNSVKLTFTGTAVPTLSNQVVLLDPNGVSLYGYLNYNGSIPSETMTFSPNYQIQAGNYTSFRVRVNSGGFASGATLSASIANVSDVQWIPVSGGSISGINSAPISVASVSYAASQPATVLSVTPSSLAFSDQVGGVKVQNQQLTLVNYPDFGGSMTVGYPNSVGVSWLSLSSPTSMGGAKTVVVSEIAYGLAAGTYTATVTITANGRTATVPVTLTVAASQSSVSGTPAFYQGSSKITSAACGTTFAFQVDGYSGSQVWLTQTKNGASSYDGILNLPYPNYTTACNRDEGNYVNTVYSVVNGQKGTLLGTVNFTINSSGGTGGGSTVLHLSAADINSLVGAWNYYAPFSRSIPLNPRPNMTGANVNSDWTVSFNYSSGASYTMAPQDFRAVVCSMITQISAYNGDTSHMNGVCTAGTIVNVSVQSSSLAPNETTQMANILDAARATLEQILQSLH